MVAPGYGTNEIYMMEYAIASMNIMLDLGRQSYISEEQVLDYLMDFLSLP